MQRNNASRGFTLIELLVVIAIIAMLASIILSSLNTARTKARDARRLADLKELQTSLELYFSDHNAYPVETSQTGVATALSALASDDYMQSVPDDPLGGSYHYVYITDTNGTKYCLGSTYEEATLPNGVIGTCSNGLSLSGIKVAVNP